MQTDRREQGEVIKIFIKWRITLIYFVEKKHLFRIKISAAMFNEHVNGRTANKLGAIRT